MILVDYTVATSGPDNATFDVSAKFAVVGVNGVNELHLRLVVDQPLAEIEV